MKKHLLQSLLAVALLLVCGNVWGADITVTWTASSGALGSSVGTGTISTGDFSWSYERTLKSGESYTGWQSGCIQLGKNGGVENITFSTSAIPGKIKSVSVECSSYYAQHKVSISVGGNTYKESTQTASWTTVSTITGTGTSSGEIVISFTDGSRALYIKTISVTYNAADEKNYDVTIADDIQNGTVSADPAQAAENEEVTLTINPAEHYQLSTLTVTDANESAIDVSGDYTFTMPACDVTVSATFTEKAKHTVTYMSLGAQVGEAENVYDGELCANMPDVTNTPEGWSFAGWTTQSSYAMSTTAPAMFSATTPVTADVTLYAVFARTTEGGAASGWYKVTENLSDWSGEYLLVYEGDNHDAVAWTGVDAANCGADVTITDGVIATKPEGAVTLTIAPMNGDYSIKVDGEKFMGRTSDANGMDFSEQSIVNTLSIDDNGNASVVSGGAYLRYNAASNQNRFRYYKSTSYTNQQPVQLYKNSGNTASHIYTTTAPQTQDIAISSVGWATACVPFTATVSGATAYTAKVEDGALVMTPITVIPAGAGVLLESVDGGATTATFTESGLEGEDVTDNQLRGNATNASVTWGNEEGATAIFTYYIFANDTEDGLGFYWQKGTGGSSVSCGAYKAALVVPGASTTEPAAIGYRLDGTTMVEQLLQESSDAAIYDLQGRKVENATKGLYIVGGKKVMVK